VRRRSQTRGERRRIGGNELLVMDQSGAAMPGLRDAAGKRCIDLQVIRREARFCAE